MRIGGLVADGRRQASLPPLGLGSPGRSPLWTRGVRSRGRRTAAPPAATDSGFAERRRRTRGACPPPRRRRRGRRRPASARISRERIGPRDRPSRMANRSRSGKRPVARRQGGLGVLEPAVGVDVAARLLGERRAGEHHVGQLRQRGDRRVLHDQELDPLAERLPPTPRRSTGRSRRRRRRGRGTRPGRPARPGRRRRSPRPGSAPGSPRRPRRFGHFSAWIVNGRGTTKLVSPVRPLVWSGVKVKSSPRTGTGPSASTVGGAQPLEVGGHQVRLLDRQERREDARDRAPLARRPAPGPGRRR